MSEAKPNGAPNEPTGAPGNTPVIDRLPRGMRPIPRPAAARPPRPAARVPKQPPPRRPLYIKTLLIPPGVIAGLVAVTPAAGNAGPLGAIALGAIASVICFFSVTKLKVKLGYDDALDAFGIHGVGGIVGAIGTGIVYSAALGGPAGDDWVMADQLKTQVLAVLATIVWAAVGTTISIYVAKALTGLRVSPEVEREGLDLGEHGERAYNM